jgi:hypothetical protein
LSRYVHALNTVKTPPAYTCDYTITDRGTRPQESTHHIFREHGRERDEIVGFNGESLGHPEVRIFVRRGDPYAVTTLSPRPQKYAFTYVGVAHNGKNLTYVFNAYAQGAPPYEVTRLAIDAATFLPLSIEFRTHTKTTEGSGQVTYRKVDRYWMPQMASARAEVNGGLETEQITWTGYQFYPNLPPSTFAAPTAVIPPQEQ